MTTSQTLRRPGPSSPGQAPAARPAVRARRTRLPVALTAAGFAVAAVLTLPLVFLLIEARGAGAAAVTDLIFRRLTADLLWNTVRLTVVVTALCAVIGTAARIRAMAVDPSPSSATVIGYGRSWRSGVCGAWVVTPDAIGYS